mmetsp:Transcript_7786/g.13109  ORF Transcript_7786/g.13109 Transcript_7786/m.13109 type:complete len:223 (-) Transcript_7786:177-845(-)
MIWRASVMMMTSWMMSWLRRLPTADCGASSSTTACSSSPLRFFRQRCSTLTTRITRISRITRPRRAPTDTPCPSARPPSRSHVIKMGMIDVYIDAEPSVSIHQSKLKAYTSQSSHVRTNWSITKRIRKMNDTHANGRSTSFGQLAAMVMSSINSAQIVATAKISWKPVWSKTSRARLRKASLAFCLTDFFGFTTFDSLSSFATGAQGSSWQMVHLTSGRCSA